MTIDNTRIVKTLDPFCFQLNYDLDFDKLIDSVDTLLTRLGMSMAMIEQRFESGNIFGYQLNLTHLPELTGNDRFLKHTGNHLSVKNEGVTETDFTEHLAEMQDLYVGQVIRDVYEQHNGKFQGRASLLWLGSNRKYNFHRDIHTPNRYHIPLVTNEECYFLLRNEVTYQLHMPVGTVWYLDPIGIEHTFVNNSNTTRLHLLLTSGF